MGYQLQKKTTQALKRKKDPRSPHLTGNCSSHISDNLRANTAQPWQQKINCFDILRFWIKCVSDSQRAKGTGSEFSWCTRHILEHPRQGLQATWQFFKYKKHLTFIWAHFDASMPWDFQNLSTHLFTSVIILPEVGEHWGWWLRLPIYRGRGGEDVPVRNIFRLLW